MEEESLAINNNNTNTDDYDEKSQFWRSFIYKRQQQMGTRMTLEEITLKANDDFETVLDGLESDFGVIVMELKTIMSVPPNTMVKPDLSELEEQYALEAEVDDAINPPATKTD